MAEDRSVFNITFDKGLDKASRPFEGDPSRALDALNYVYDDGRVRKRSGHNHLLNIAPIRYYAVGFDGSVNPTLSTNGTRINGLWNFKAEDGKRHFIAHVGKLLCEIKQDGERWLAEPIEADTQVASYADGNYPKCYEFEDYRSVAVIGGYSLYFFGGNKYMRLRYNPANSVTYRTFEPVEDGAGTYIPTTTISIPYERARADVRQSLDEVNLLNRKRRNELISGVGYPDGAEGLPKYYEYVLDSPIVCADRIKDMAEFRITMREREREETDNG